jgi:hypothetical protein
MHVKLHFLHQEFLVYLPVVYHRRSCDFVEWELFRPEAHSAAPCPVDVAYDLILYQDAGSFSLLTLIALVLMSLAFLLTPRAFPPTPATVLL